MGFQLNIYKWSSMHIKTKTIDTSISTINQKETKDQKMLKEKLI